VRQYLFFGLFLFFDLHASAPFPISTLDKHILNVYLPDIFLEVEKTFVLQDDGRTRRNTREYGFSFFKLEQDDYTYIPPPDFLQELGAHICSAFGHPPQPFTNIIVSLYEEGFHLEPHIDTHAAMPNRRAYFFTDRVYGIIIEADASGHLFFVKDEEHAIPPLNLEPVYELEEEKGMIFCLEGVLRTAPFFHGVTPVTNRRLSITFRSVIFPSEI
jgi:hypothetical protein